MSEKISPTATSRPHPDEMVVDFPYNHIKIPTVLTSFLIINGKKPQEDLAGPTGKVRVVCANCAIITEEGQDAGRLLLERALGTPHRLGLRHAAWIWKQQAEIPAAWPQLLLFPLTARLGRANQTAVEADYADLLPEMVTNIHIPTLCRAGNGQWEPAWRDVSGLSLHALAEVGVITGSVG